MHLLKEGLYNPAKYNQIFDNLSIPYDQIKMRDAYLDMEIIWCFSTSNNIYSLSKIFDFLARQHQFEQRTAVIVNPNMENLSKEEFFYQLFFLAKSADIRKIVYTGYYEQIPHNDDIRITKYDTVQDYIDNFEHNAHSSCGVIFRGKG